MARLFARKKTSRLVRKTEPAARSPKPSKNAKFVYFFGHGKAEGNRNMKDLLGGKGSGLAEMTNAGLPVPPGMTISTEACTLYYQQHRKTPKQVDEQMLDGLRKLQKAAGAKLGDVKNPLLVSVRSGAKFSMPGMMDTILNLGLNDQTVLALVKATNNERFAWDCYRRFVQMYGDVVMGVQKGKDEDHEPFEVVIHGFKHEKYHADIEDSKLTAADQQELVTVTGVRDDRTVLERRRQPCLRKLRVR